jgi:hypothetical protein
LLSYEKVLQQPPGICLDLELGQGKMPCDKMLPCVDGAVGEVVIEGDTVSIGTAPPVDSGRMGVRGVMGTTGMGLIPASPSSMDPIGMPTPPPDNFGKGAGDELALPAPAQALDAVPAMPPPSNIAIED